jgi:hypothetical protein
MTFKDGNNVSFDQIQNIFNRLAVASDNAGKSI